MAAIPTTRRFYHFGKIVRSRAGINVEEAEKAQCSFLVANEIFEIEHTFLRFEGIELSDVMGVGFKLLQALLKVHSRASEVVRSKAVVWIAQQQRDPFVNLRSACIIQPAQIAPFRLSPDVMRAIEKNRTLRDDLGATGGAHAREIYRAITQPVQTAALK